MWRSERRYRISSHKDDGEVGGMALFFVGVMGFREFVLVFHRLDVLDTRGATLCMIM